MTTGQFIYSNKGKQFKIFSAHDSDGLKFLSNFFKSIITADKRGYSIKKENSDDLNFKLQLITEKERYKFVKK